MATILEFRVALEDFAMAHTLQNVSNTQIKIEQFAAQATDTALPFIWVTTDDIDAFETAVAADPSVADCTLLTDGAAERFYRITWADGVERVIDLFLANESTIMSAQTSGEAWKFQVMCPEHETVATIYNSCTDKGLSLTVDMIYECAGSAQLTYGLTDIQRTSLTTARELGYYDIPRDISLSELADELGVSHQALSERLRRGHGTLVDRTLNVENPMQIEHHPD